MSQHKGEPGRRWFYSPEMDLIVWVDDGGAPVGFQLTYEDANIDGAGFGERKILTWLPDRGYSHESLDDGEGRPFRYKMAPVAVPDGVFERDLVLVRFLRESADMDSALREFVAGRLREYPA